MNRFFSLLLALSMAVSLVGCSPAAPVEQEDTVSITLWTYPIGNWGDDAVVGQLLDGFHRDHPEIRVTVEYLDYTNGDDQINTAIEGGQAPDLVMEGPERLVANWGARGLLVDLSELWTEDVKADVYPMVEAACRSKSGAYYEYPLCMTAHTMAVNRELFEASGAWQYIDEQSHTWSTEDFLNAVAALVSYGHSHVGAIYCAGPGGDQGTRALVTNLYGGRFTNQEHTAYTVDSPENIRALETLYNTQGLSFDPSIAGSDEISLFLNGTLAMAFCWNVAQEKNHADALSFDVFPMAFPTNGETPRLTGGIWGFGVFDNGSAEKIQGAKTFLRWICDTNGEEAVRTSTYWPVRKSLGNMYEGDERMTQYGILNQYYDEYDQVTLGWPQARTAWWNMLQAIAGGMDIPEAAAEFTRKANEAAGA